jgi:hypothetical protein
MVEWLSGLRNKIVLWKRVYDKLDIYYWVLKLSIKYLSK